MAAAPLELLDLRSRSAWRKWLAKHHDKKAEIWLVYHKKHTGVACIEYGDSVEEALCFGWVDNLIRRLDEDRFARKFTPRNESSKWSTSNRKRYQKLLQEGRLEQPGLDRPPTDLDGDSPKPKSTTPPPYIRRALKASPRAQAFFEGLAPSYRREFIGWVDSAKRQETRDRRLLQMIELLQAGKKLGMK